MNSSSAVAAHGWCRSGNCDNKRKRTAEEVSYGLGKTFWGRGIATQALALFLAEVSIRPIHARVAKDNAASLRVLERNGFTISGEDRGFAEGRGAEIEEWLLVRQA